MALGLTTLLPTPYGWTSVYDLNPDTILLDELGYPCRIKELSQPYETDTHVMQAGWSQRSIPESDEIIVSNDQSLMSFTYKRFEDMSRLQDESKTMYLEQLPSMPENWPVWSRAEVPRAAKTGRKAKPKAQTFTAVEVAETIKYQRKKNLWLLNHAVPITFPLQLKKQDLTIPPYLLGVLINYTI